MFRRNAILLALSCPTACLSVDDDDLPSSALWMPRRHLAQDLAEFELRALQADHPDDWQSVSYVADIALDNQWSAIYVVTGDARLLGLWFMRVDHAMYPGSLRTYDIGKAGQYPGNDDGFNHVTLLIVERAGLELELSAFADLKAKHPEPQGPCHG